jgi:hypothetical protein
MPTTTEILRSHPFLAIQPAEIRESLKASAKESMMLRASLLYRENSRPDGVYLIANGVVKVSEMRYILFTFVSVAPKFHMQHLKVMLLYFLLPLPVE